MSLQPTTAFAIALGSLLACGDDRPPSRADAIVRMQDTVCRARERCSYTFGPVQTHAVLVRAFTIRNTGDVPIDIRRVSVVGDVVFRLAFDDLTHLNPGDSSAFAISAAPTEPQRSDAELFVSTSADDSPIRVSLVVDGTLTGLQFTPACDFGQVELGTTSQPCTIVFSNLGDTDAAVDAIYFTGPPFAPASAVAFPILISSHEEYSLSVVASPTTLGPSAGWLDLERDATVVSGAIRLFVDGI